MNSSRSCTRREFGQAAGMGAAAFVAGHWPFNPSAAAGATQETTVNTPAPAAIRAIDDKFFIRPEELTLRALQPPGRRALSFANFKGAPEEWRKACKAKLAELLGLSATTADAFRPPRDAVRRVRSIQHDGVTIEAWVMPVDKNLSIPAYLLIPPAAGHAKTAPPGTTSASSPDTHASSIAQAQVPVLAIHGHGAVEPCLDASRDDYHHAFALRLAQGGHVVLAPELRGFSALADMSRSDEGHWLDYWDSRRGHQFTLVTDGFLYGRTLIGETIEDLLRWEAWLADVRGVRALDVAGISYGGDLAFTYPVFSSRVRRIYTSGSLGSFAGVFARCYNAPAHCIPGVLRWLDRSDIAGLNAPRPIRVHYGELDKPGPDNASAAYNETVEPALAELRAIYKTLGGVAAEKEVTLRVTPGREHEFEIEDLTGFLG